MQFGETKAITPSNQLVKKSIEGFSTAGDCESADGVDQLHEMLRY